MMPQLKPGRDRRRRAMLVLPSIAPADLQHHDGPVTTVTRNVLRRSPATSPTVSFHRRAMAGPIGLLVRYQTLVRPHRRPPASGSAA
jgi:hypothetical protein